MFVVRLFNYKDNFSWQGLANKTLITDQIEQRVVVVEEITLQNQNFCYI